ncbi:hypothetical protein HA402_009216 [Bradysia odoriphaga]|nr:hypothetical protein HA402_009216 [Bradysia odoriphaga]
MDVSSDSEDSEVINFQDVTDSDELEEPYNDDLSVASSSSNKDQVMKQKYEIMSTSGLICTMKNDSQTVVNILLVSEPIARLLMNHFKWNVEKLMNDYYAAHNLDVFFESVGIGNPESFAYTVADPIIECEICLLPFTEVNSISFVCGHQFCDSCCCRYFEEKILNDGEANNIRCPHSSCKMLIDDDTVLNLISENARQRWEILIAHTFVKSHPLMRYCRSEDCEYAVKVKVLEPSQVICKCGYESCLKCGEMWHDSVTCDLLKKWIEIQLEDVESAKWMKEHAKRCPNCKINIEKNGGCNHMSCRSCRHEFCWVCMQDWRGHGSCNQYQDNEHNLTERLIHYSVRYNNHIRSVRLERGLYNSVESRMENLEGTEGMTRNEVIFLKRAVESLRRSRQMLISTYVFAFYSKRCNQLAIFEDNQRDLELATEDLSWFLEQEITNESIVTIKQKLQEKSTYCDQRRGVLLGHIQEGYDNRYWELEDLL